MHFPPVQENVLAYFPLIQGNVMSPQNFSQQCMSLHCSESLNRVVGARQCSQRLRCGFPYNSTGGSGSNAVVNCGYRTISSTHSTLLPEKLLFYKTRAEFTLSSVSINNVSSSTIISSSSTSEALSAAIKSSSDNTIGTIQWKRRR